MDLSRARNADNRRQLIFANELYRAYLGELADVTAYTHYAIVSEAISPTVAALFMELAEDEMQHFAHLGRLLYSLGFSPAVDTRLRDTPVDTKHGEPSVRIPQRHVRERIVEEKQGAENYRRLADIAPTPESAALMRELATDEERHSTALMRAMERRDRS